MTTRPDLVHLMPAAGGEHTLCCLSRPDELPLTHWYTRDRADVTCTLRERAELAVDLDGGESPFGWRDLPQEGTGTCP
ncbi:hypothetical protein [Streptomyces werraensis]|uniref:hypothetical protein n=1 Tax=Streptomyces werraensis TaxID=68284 RepID=UPI0037D2D20E